MKPAPPTTPPTDQVDGTDVHQEPTTANYMSVARDRPRSCVTEPVDVCLVCAFPCVPLARASASVGINYVGVFLLTTLVYGGGIACFVASTLVMHPLMGFSIGLAMLAAWILNMVGAVASGTYVVSLWILKNVLEAHEDDGWEPGAPASPASTRLLVAQFCSQLLFLALVAYVRHRLLKRTHASSCAPSGIGSCCFTLCLPCCSFAEAMHSVRVAQDDKARRPTQDELPAYVA